MHQLPSDLSEWRLLQRDGRLLLVSRHGVVSRKGHTPEDFREAVKVARDWQRYALTTDPVTLRKR